MQATGKRNRLYTDCPVDLTTERKTKVAYSRFWYFMDDEKAMIVCWNRENGSLSEPYPMAVNISSIDVSEKPADPPPMPEWAIQYV
jgi:hypothetical protein